MQSATHNPPRTIMEVYRMLPEGTLAEVINGILYLSPAPSTEHQNILLDLIVGITNLVKSSGLGKTFVSPYDVFLDEKANAVQPDIIFVASHHKNIIKEDAIHGTPDLLIEILSPGNSKRDKVTKKELYEKFGVKEYWIIDPETKLAVGFKLEQGAFEKIGEFQSQIHSVLLGSSFSF